MLGRHHFSVRLGGILMLMIGAIIWSALIQSNAAAPPLATTVSIIDTKQDEFQDKTTAMPLDKHITDMGLEKNGAPILLEEQAIAMPLEESSNAISLEENTVVMPLQENSTAVPLEMSEDEAASMAAVELFVSLGNTSIIANANFNATINGTIMNRNHLGMLLEDYSDAIEMDPTNYSLVFKRGAIFFAMGKTELALQDFTNSVALKAQYLDDREHRRANINEEVDDLAMNDINTPMPNQEHKWAMQLLKAKKNRHFAGKRVAQELMVLEPLIMALDQEHTSYVESSDKFDRASQDMMFVKQMLMKQFELANGFFNNSLLFYHNGDVENAMATVEECLKIAPSHSDCLTLRTKLQNVRDTLRSAATASRMGYYQDCIGSALMVLNHERVEQFILSRTSRLLCRCLVANAEYERSEHWCNQALSLKRDSEFLCLRGTASLFMGDIEKSVMDFEAAHSLDQTKCRFLNTSAILKRLHASVGQPEILSKLSQMNEYQTRNAAVNHHHKHANNYNKQTPQILPAPTIKPIIMNQFQNLYQTVKLQQTANQLTVPPLTTGNPVVVPTINAYTPFAPAPNAAKDEKSFHDFDEEQYPELTNSEDFIYPAVNPVQ